MTAQPVINVHDAKTHFSKLLERAHSGQEIVLSKAGKPYARLMPLPPVLSQRQAGRLAHLGPVEAAFFEALPETEVSGWEPR
jgi:prevent-host-death family protein